MINPWKVLGVHLKSTDEEIRAAYLKFARVFHPDNKKGDSGKFHIVNSAYQHIKDKKARLNLMEHYLYLAKKCSKCSGKGATSKSKGLHGKTYTSCDTCCGAGVIIPTKENEDVIELHGTASPRTKGSNRKR